MLVNGILFSLLSGNLTLLVLGKSLLRYPPLKTDGELAGVVSAYDRHQSISQSATVLPF